MNDFVGEALRSMQIIATPYRWPDPAKIPKRQFLFGRHYIRKTIGATIGGGARRHGTAMDGRPAREGRTSFYTELSANLCEQVFHFAQFSFETCDVGLHRREFGHAGGWRLSR